MPEISPLIYLAAHAPQVPEWFIPFMKTERPQNKQERRECESIMSGQKSSIQFVKVNQAEQDEWDLECKRQKLFQWPLVWAKEQLKSLNGE